MECDLHAPTNRNKPFWRIVMAAANITIGSRFTRWTVLSESFMTGKSHIVAKCKCDCGTVRLVRVARLISGKSKSCGCWRNDNLTTHGMTAGAVRKDSHEYWIWNMIVQRCTNPKVKNWHDYGGRGITVCDSWLKFENFYADMGARPSRGHSIEREDNDGGYHKGNCRWATRLEQGKNKRNNRIIEAFGKRQHLAEWARQAGLHHVTILNRLARGWANEKAVSTPAGRQGKRHS
jgi:hypothetical protein